ncbi:hypothetical protein BS47DRAFT_1338307 [Hydnum rufescens UP504]|uniref:Uncharacterized protein n=1 Tax=Hydnum rufescens UP504 TaxID=1448309 RepID=A0A9P6B6E4_9AGAM|nr:hypothetical protein BS47DRAFT_1338307 [Hydnum rufescens UP504]
MASSKIAVIAGVGTGRGTGGAIARRFANAGYKVALLARNGQALQALSDSIKATGGLASPFPLSAYSHSEISLAFDSIKKEWPGDSIRVTIWNVGEGIFLPFLDITEEHLQKTVDTKQELDNQGSRGTLIVTGATASLRGNVITSAFASGKFALRALSQSLAKEYGKQNIHVSHVVIDGAIATDRKYAKDDNPDEVLHPEAIAEAYEFLTRQHRSAWTWELDLRPAHEKW